MTFGASIEFAAMAAIVDALDGLDVEARKRILAGVEAWYANHSAAKECTPTLASSLVTRPSQIVGRPHSPNTRRIIDSLRDQSPATPLAISGRTALDRKLVKSALHRLAKTGVVVREARGLYRLANTDAGSTL